MDQVWRINFRNNSDCILEDLVMSLEYHVEDAIAKKLISAPDLFRNVPNGDRLAQHYPKNCHSCQQIFTSREHYISVTEKSDREQEPGQSIEYRQCRCGSPLVQVIPNTRRDSNAFGMECRAYFDICVEKLIREQGFQRSEAKDLTRIIFQQVFESCAKAS